ncbi:MAG: tRNA (adenosine(37)-N6)-threonylcarbamoyltransferase complex dimerization subunit type 1 TsaB [Oscillospiraceae bacterium]|jgi:tRNA threonylcarbamoyladenosine biosynthesis protein TsaB|nr:tRNA (adenosine(37)-N6)-threonylcarbamoyltransferase complex dimerization subunit type 1 TsaB [Oscillospiraceae bacterium]
MLTLGLDTTGRCASAALAQGDRLLSECFAAAEQRHSASIIPLLEQCLRQADTARTDIDRFAVTCGPGSFTGVRIGVAAVKGMAQALRKPCAGVSTLAALAAPAMALPGLLCCALDARRGQAYAALFRAGQRLTEDAAIPLAALEALLLSHCQPNEIIWFLGDAAPLCQAAMSCPQSRLAPPALRETRGSGAIFAASPADFGTAAALRVQYLRPSQAERELQEKMSIINQNSESDV